MRIFLISLLELCFHLDVFLQNLCHLKAYKKNYLKWVIFDYLCQFYLTTTMMMARINLAKTLTSHLILGNDELDKNISIKQTHPEASQSQTLALNS